MKRILLCIFFISSFQFLKSTSLDQLLDSLKKPTTPAATSKAPTTPKIQTPKVISTKAKTSPSVAKTTPTPLVKTIPEQKTTAKVLTSPAKIVAKKTTPTQTVPVTFPTVIITNVSTKPAQITGISIIYKVGTKTTTINTPPIKINIKPNQTGKFPLKLTLPITSNETSISPTFLGVSQISIENQNIQISPAWTSIPGSTIASSFAIYITKTGNNWALDTKTMLKSAKSGSTPVQPVTLAAQKKTLKAVEAAVTKKKNTSKKITVKKNKKKSQSGNTTNKPKKISS